MTLAPPYLCNSPHSREHERPKDSFVRNERQNVTVNAVALSRGRGAVVEHMAEMDAGTGTSDFGAAHTERCIHMFRQCARHGAEKTRPARAAVELGVAAE